MSNLQSQISNISSALQAVYPKDEAASLAWWIMEEETGLTRSQLLCGCKDTTNFANMQKIQTIIDRLLHFEPIQYIFGHTLWNGLDLKVTAATLIPRPETAELVEIIVNNFNRQSIVNRKSSNRQLSIDFVNIPDLYPAIALTCERLGITLYATGTERLRYKESDRLEAVRLHEVRNDHRIAMALMAADYPVSQDEQRCIAKSYPAFVAELCGV